jgi:hypothetical protein
VLLDADDSYQHYLRIVLAVFNYLDQRPLAALLLEQFEQMANQVSMSLVVSIRDQETLEAKDTLITIQAIVC